MRILEFTGLGPFAQHRAGTLGTPGRKRLEIARALATEPRLLLLDEALAGLTPSEIQQAIALVRAIHTMGVTLLIVEHLMEVIFTLAPRVIVFHQGKIIAAQHLQRGIRAGCLPDGIAFFPEHRGEDVADGPVVVHHQHGGRPPLSDVGIDRRELGRRVERLAAEPQHLVDSQHPSVR